MEWKVPNIILSHHLDLVFIITDIITQNRSKRKTLHTHRMWTDIRELPRCCVAQDYLKSRRVFLSSYGTMKRYKPRSMSFNKLLESTAYSYENRCERSLKKKSKRAVLVTRTAKDFSLFSPKFQYDNWSKQIMEFWRFRASTLLFSVNAIYHVKLSEPEHSSHRSAKRPKANYGPHSDIWERGRVKTLCHGRRFWELRELTVVSINIVPTLQQEKLSLSCQWVFEGKKTKGRETRGKNSKGNNNHGKVKHKKKDGTSRIWTVRNKYCVYKYNLVTKPGFTGLSRFWSF